MSSTRTGSCRCGAVTFEVTGPSRFSCYCHCVNCRRVNSAPVTMIVALPKTSFKWTKGEEKVSRFALSEKFDAIYCSACGGQIAQDPKAAPFIGTFPATYDENKGKYPITTLDSFFKPNMHLNYENRLMDISDDLPKYLDFPSQFGGSGKMHE
jgi:hypothetical protein